MNLSEAEGDYIAELFKVGLEEVAERVAVITGESVGVTLPKVLVTPDIAAVANSFESDLAARGTLASLPLSGGFNGCGILFLNEPGDAEFATLLSQQSDDDIPAQDKVLQELSGVLLEQYVVVMTDLLNLGIDCGEFGFEHLSLIEQPDLVSACNKGALCITMSFSLTERDIHCHILFIHESDIDELLDVVKAALTDLGLV